MFWNDKTHPNCVQISLELEFKRAPGRWLSPVWPRGWGLRALQLGWTRELGGGSFSSCSRFWSLVLISVSATSTCSDLTATSPSTLSLWVLRGSTLAPGASNFPNRVPFRSSSNFTWKGGRPSRKALILLGELRSAGSSWFFRFWPAPPVPAETVTVRWLKSSACAGQPVRALLGGGCSSIPMMGSRLVSLASVVAGLLVVKRLLRLSGSACSGGGVMGAQGGLVPRSCDRASDRQRVKVWNWAEPSRVRISWFTWTLQSRFRGRTRSGGRGGRLLASHVPPFWTPSSRLQPQHSACLWCGCGCVLICSWPARGVSGLAPVGWRL